MSVRRQRLDAELVRQRLAGSREEAARLVAEGAVLLNGVRAVKPATAVPVGAVLEVGVPAVRYASRGAGKLLAAIERFAGHEPALRVAGRRCLDAGASTGGFTDVLLEAGAAEVHAVDVGYGQLLWRLRNDPRVVIHDRTNVRHLEPHVLGGPVELTVADLSFISLTLVFGALAACTAAAGDIVTLVKPQFEVGRGRVGKGGVVRDRALHAEAVLGVRQVAEGLGWHCQGVVRSPLPGPAGNLEYLTWWRTDPGLPADEAREAVLGGDR